MENEIETTINSIIRYILGLHRDNGKENGSYYKYHNRVYIGVVLLYDAASRIAYNAAITACERGRQWPQASQQLLANVYG